MFVIERDNLVHLFTALQQLGYTTVGPRLRDGAIVLDELRSPDDLPSGIRDEHSRGGYRTTQTGRPALFSYVVGPQSCKKYLYPSRFKLFTARKNGKEFHVEPDKNAETRKFAFIGARACDLAAIDVLDKVLLHGPYVDESYRARRSGSFVVAVNCTVPAANCFCVSMQTGPRASRGFDLALTEVEKEGKHIFVAEVGSDRGRELMEKVPHRTATDEEMAESAALVEQAAASMTKSVNTENLAKSLEDRFEDARWDGVAKRCLACANCTMVCPTCFCTNVEDVTAFDGTTAERWRQWDSCFTSEFTHIAGGNIRMSTRSRYRQWLLHKFAFWQGQFNTFGCVGCGRCITWCPVGIDVTEEIQVLQQSPIPTRTL
ncbi:MAG TPA: 4Fe-4S dicluster domain-containing protein [Bacteroidota bacterium]|nr:4Fe-4S dicluster domain-containing protein [Bacteroidota bacterium]